MTIILGGIYDALDCAELRGQLARRGATAHLPRYHLDIEAEVRAFRMALNTLLKALPIPVTGKVACDWLFFYKMPGLYRHLERSSYPGARAGRGIKAKCIIAPNTGGVSTLPFGTHSNGR